jgi:hypothetical protein
VYGVAMNDPDRILGGDARRARWLTFRPGDSRDPAVLLPLIREARRIALLSAAEREVALRTLPAS